jgi:hypothetical protein
LCRGRDFKWFQTISISSLYASSVQIAFIRPCLGQETLPYRWGTMLFKTTPAELRPPHLQEEAQRTEEIWRNFETVGDVFAVRLMPNDPTCSRSKVELHWLNVTFRNILGSELRRREDWKGWKGWKGWTFLWIVDIVVIWGAWEIS